MMKNIRFFNLLKSQNGFNSLWHYEKLLSPLSSIITRGNVNAIITAPVVKRAVMKSSSSQVTNTTLLGRNTLLNNILKHQGTRQLFGHNNNSRLSSMQPFLTRSLSLSSLPLSQSKDLEYSIFSEEDDEEEGDEPLPRSIFYAMFIFYLGLAVVPLKEIVISPPELKIYRKALKRIQNESKVKDIIGTRIIGYLQKNYDSRIAKVNLRDHHVDYKTWTDEYGVQRFVVRFGLRGPKGHGKVKCEMFKNNVDGQWKYASLRVKMYSFSSGTPKKVLVLEPLVPPVGYKPILNFGKKNSKYTPTLYVI